MASTARLDSAVPYAAYMGLPQEPPTLLDARRPEVERALRAVAARAGGVIWTAEPGMGRSTLLDTVYTALTTTSTAAHEIQPHTVRFSGQRLGGDPSLTGVLAALAPQVARMVGMTAAPATNKTDEQPPRAVDVAALMRSAAGTAPVVMLVDDIDVLDQSAMEFLLQLVGQHDAAVVLLATAATHPCEQIPHYGIEVRPLPALGAEGALRVLQYAITDPIAPAVAGRLARELQGNAACIVQTAQLLGAEHLAGAALMPDPLPLVPAVSAVVGEPLGQLTADQRRALLIATVAVVDRTEVLTAASGLSIEQLTDGELSQHLEFVAGSFRFVDPRVRSAIHSEASLAARTEAHHALAQAHRGANEADIATWHTALATLEGSPAVVPGLLDLARRHLKRGDTEWAHAVAREAVGHATGDAREQAREVAGLAAVLSGHMEDGARWLRHAARGGDIHARARTLLGLVMALTHVEGQVPDDVLERVRADVVNMPDAPVAARHGVARGMAVAACLHMERGSSEVAWQLLDQAASLVADSPELREGLDLTRAWLSMYATPAAPEGAAAVAHVGADDQALAALGRAVALMHDDRCDAAASVIASALADLSPVRTTGRWFDGAERAVSPLVNAHLRVVQALVEMRVGDCARARATIHDAIHALPVGLVLAGLGTVLARRLDMICQGALSPVTEALAATSTSAAGAAVRRGRLVDRALGAAFGRRHTEAATLLELAAQREHHDTTAGLAIPGLDIVETWAMAGRQADARRALEVLREQVRGLSEAAQARVIVRAELGVAEPDAQDQQIARAVELMRDTASPYERARTELSIARALARARRGDQARVHYIAAQDLFDEAGAHGWLSAIADEVVPSADSNAPARPPAARPPSPLLHQPTSPGPAFVPGAVQAQRDMAQRSASVPLGDGWEAGLTERELDVARLVVDGMSNRAVAQQLYLSVRTVEVHLGRVFRKLGVHSRVELAVLAHRQV